MKINIPVILCICLSCFEGLAQYRNYPGVEVSGGLGFSRNQKNYLQNIVPAAHVSGLLHAPLIWDKLYVLAGVSAEMSTKGNSAIQETRMLGSQVLFVTPQLRLEYMWKGRLNSVQYSVGMGRARRYKAVEYNLWEKKPDLGFPTLWANRTELYQVFGRTYIKKKHHELVFEMMPTFERRELRNGTHSVTFNSLSFTMGWVYRPARKVKPQNAAHINRTLIGGETTD